MRLIQETELKIEWRDVLGRAYKEKLGSETRSSGVHLSGIIQYCLDLGHREDEDPDEMPLCMAVGLAWESWSVGLFPNVVWQPGEEELDGVYGTPDGLSALDIEGSTEIVVEEWKCSWKSKHTHGDILQERIWIWQLQGLCVLTGLRHARIHVLFLNGNYRPPKPCYMTYLIEFTQAELDKFWSNIVLANRDRAIPEIHE